MRPILAVLFASIFAASLAAQQSVWFADDQPCPVADFSSAQAAIDAAGEGDLVVLRHDAGDEALVVDGKSITLVGYDLDERPGVGGGVDGVVVRNLAAGQSVTLRGLVLEPRLQVLDCQGAVWVEDCFVGPAPFALAAPSVRVVDSAAVSLLRCSVTGSASDPGADGLLVDGGSVFAYGCSLFGGTPATGIGALPGGHGVRVVGDGFVLLDDCLVRGGNGAFSGSCAAGDGGDGLRLQNLGSTAWSVGSELLGGLGSPAAFGCPPGQPGLPVGGNGAANLAALGGEPRGLTAPALAFEGETVELQFDSQPGDHTFVLLALDMAPLKSSAFDGAILPLLPGLLIDFGAPSGTVLAKLPPDLVPAGMALPLVLQGLALDGLDKRAGSASWLTVLDVDLQDELDCAVTLWVDDDAPGDPHPGDPSLGDPLEDGSSEHPFDSIQEAIDASSDGVEIVVRDGLYDTYPANALNIGERLIEVRSENGPDACTIQAGLRGFRLGGEPQGTVIRGFTITGASIAAVGTSSVFSNARVLDCRLIGNLRGVMVTDSAADVTLEDCLLAENIQSAGRVLTGQLRMWRCDVRDNGDFGINEGALDVRDAGYLELHDCMVVRNTNILGAAVQVRGNLNATGCTFALNPSSSIGPEILIRDDGSASLSHCIVWGQEQPVLVLPGGALFIDHSLLKHGEDGVNLQPGGTATLGPGIVMGAPAFKDPANDDFHLGPSSPCIDAGDPLFLVQPGQTDIDGQPRVQGGLVDIGADERE